jgi:hypothetical protein
MRTIGDVSEDRDGFAETLYKSGTLIEMSGEESVFYASTNDFSLQSSHTEQKPSKTLRVRNFE